MDLISVFAVVSEVSIDQAFHFSVRCCRVLMPVSSRGVSSRCEDEQSMFGRYSTSACHRNDRRLLLVKRDCVYLIVRGREWARSYTTCLYSTATVRCVRGVCVLA